MRKVSFIVLSFCLSVLCLSACAEGSAKSELVLNADDSSLAGETETADFSGPAAGSRTTDPAAAASGSGSSEKPTEIVVHVCGAVEREGVYTLPDGSRVYEAVAAAGGFAQEADTEAVNQAQILEDGIRLRIPTLEESAVLADPAAGNVLPVIDKGPAVAAQGTASDGRININTADENMLCELNGVGPGTAARIIAYREENGPFSVIEDIMKVPGIKEKIFSKIKDDITV